MEKVTVNVIVNEDGLKEANGIKFGNFHFDLFETENGSLGITVYPKGKDPNDESTDCVDIFISEKLKVTHC